VLPSFGFFLGSAFAAPPVLGFFVCCYCSILIWFRKLSNYCWFILSFLYCYSFKRLSLAWFVSSELSLSKARMIGVMLLMKSVIMSLFFSPRAYAL
jgi:hypothetical protein